MIEFKVLRAKVFYLRGFMTQGNGLRVPLTIYVKNGPSMAGNH